MRGRRFEEVGVDLVVVVTLVAGGRKFWWWAGGRCESRKKLFFDPNDAVHCDCCRP